MIADNGSRQQLVSDRPRYATVIGILVVVGLAPILLQNSVNNYRLGCSPFFRKLKIAETPEEQLASHTVVSSDNSSMQKISSNDSCTDCLNDREFTLSDSTETLRLEFERQQCLGDIRSRMLDLYRPFFENVSKVVLIDVALHFNLGDTILWRAALHLAAMLSHTVHYICVGSQHSDLYETFPRCDMEKLIQLVKDNGLIMYSPGGNWGNLYRYVQTYRLEALEKLGTAYEAENATFKVVQLPQSIAYTPDEVTDITEDDAVINSLPSGMFTLLTRQDDSFEWARKHYNNNINVLESPDMAFALGPLWPIGKTIMDVVFIMRDDEEGKETSQSLETQVAERFEGTGLTYSLQGWDYFNETDEYAEAHPSLLSEVRLNAAISIVSRGKVLITNRFHAHVVGMMIGTTTFWIDTIQEKLKHSRSVAFDSSTHCTHKSMRSFGFESTMEAIDVAISYLGSHRPNSQPH